LSWQWSARFCIWSNTSMSRSAWESRWDLCCWLEVICFLSAAWNLSRSCFLQGYLWIVRDCFMPSQS
jgi:hypothetical protein